MQQPIHTVFGCYLQRVLQQSNGQRTQTQSADCCDGAVYDGQCMAHLAHASPVSAVATGCPKHLASRTDRRRAWDNPYECLHQPIMPPPSHRPVDSRRLAQCKNTPPPKVGCSGDRRPMTKVQSCGSRSLGRAPNPNQCLQQKPNPALHTCKLLSQQPRTPNIC